MPRGQHPEAREAYERMAADQQLHAALAAEPHHDNNTRVSERVHYIWDQMTSLPPHPQLVSNFFSWVGKPGNRDSQHLALYEILKERQSRLVRLHSQKRRIVNLSNLNPGTLDKGAFLNQILIRQCERLPSPFPPPLLYVSETADIFDQNMAFVLERELPDNRIPRKFIFRLDKSSEATDSAGLVHDLNPTEEAQFVDDNGELVAVAIRNACSDSRIVAFADRSVKKVIRSRRNARKEDRGHISQMGLSAGSRSNPSLGWVRNVEREKKNVNFHQEVNYDASSSFAILWSLVRSLLPETIIHDFELFIETLGLDLRMDGDQTMGASSAGRGCYRIQIEDAEFKFYNSELAPPCGVVAENYCRYIHYEKQPHTWAVSLTTSRSFGPSIMPLEAGGHFYISSYGIRIQAAPNTLIAWRPADWHGTSLFRISPNTGSPAQQYYQRGLCIVTGMRVMGAIKKWRAGQLSDEELNEIEEHIDECHITEEQSGGSELDDFIEALQKAPPRRSLRLAGKPRKYFGDC